MRPMKRAFYERRPFTSTQILSSHRRLNVFLCCSETSIERQMKRAREPRVCVHHHLWSTRKLYFRRRDQFDGR